MWSNMEHLAFIYIAHWYWFIVSTCRIVLQLYLIKLYETKDKHNNIVLSLLNMDDYIDVLPQDAFHKPIVYKCNDYFGILFSISFI